MISIFFLRFWRQTGDRFFLLFAASFMIKSIERAALLVMADLTESSPQFYLIRMFSFVLIIVAIPEKNRRCSTIYRLRARRPPLPEQMELMTDTFMILAGGLLLYFGAEWFVDGSARLARLLGLSPVLIGLTVVGYGTSAPEMIVGIEAAMAGHGPIALGNVVGSNIANLGLILGVTALVRPPYVNPGFGRREVPVLLSATALVPLLLWDGTLSRLEALLLIGGAIAYTGWMVGSARRERQSLRAAAETAKVMSEVADVAGAATPDHSRRRLPLTALIGLTLLVFGGALLVDGAAGIARSLGMSEQLVGLTIVAIGTSVPELATSIIAAWRGATGIALGNVIGSNIFNSLLCLGTAAFAGEVSAPPGTVWIDLFMMMGLTVLVCGMVRTERTVTRVEGGLLTVAYAAFTAARLVWG